MPIGKQVLSQKNHQAVLELGHMPGDSPPHPPGLVGPIPENWALQLVSSLPSAQLAKPSHTESGSRQMSWSQENSSWAQLPGGGGGAGDIWIKKQVRVSTSFDSAGSGQRGEKWTIDR